MHIHTILPRPVEKEEIKSQAVSARSRSYNTPKWVTWASARAQHVVVAAAGRGRGERTLVWWSPGGFRDRNIHDSTGPLKISPFPYSRIGACMSPRSARLCPCMARSFLGPFYASPPPAGDVYIRRARFSSNCYQARWTRRVELIIIPNQFYLISGFVIYHVLL